MSKINVGLFVDTVSGNDFLQSVYEELSNSEHVLDISVFYKEASDDNPKYLKCGLFPSVNIMDFKGVLICDSIENAYASKEAINSINIYSSLKGYTFIKYYFMGSHNSCVKYFATTKEQNELFYRETRNKVDIDCSTDLSKLTKYIIENER